MREGEYQNHIIRKLNHLFPGCFILKNDSSYLQGVPDLLVLFHDKWAMLEVKTSLASKFQPNQEYFIDVLDEMSFAAIVYPENEEVVLHALQHTFSVGRATRVSKR